VPGSFLEALASGRFRWEVDHDGHLFIDRSPNGFAPVLAWLRDQGLQTQGSPSPFFLHELDYFGLKVRLCVSLID
jgi:hypothetical protein